MSLSGQNIIFDECYCGSRNYKVFRDFGENKVIECISCGLLRSFPLPLESVCDNNYQEVNESQKLHYHQLTVLKQVMKFAGDKNARVLDIGCSTGTMLKHLEGKGYGNISGIEMNKHAVEICLKKNINVKRIGIENEDEKEKYDIVYLNHVFEHIADIRNFFKNLKLHLNCGAYVVVAVPNIGGRDTDSSEWIGYQFSQHYWHFTPRSLLRIFSENKFTICKKILLTGGRIKSLIYKIFGCEGDSLIAVFKYNG